MKFRLSLAIVIALTISFTACNNKSNYNDLQTCFRDYLDFEEGSYWVYKDSITDELDTIFVNEYRRDYSVNGCCGINCTNDYNQTIRYKTRFNKQEVQVILNTNGGTYNESEFYFHANDSSLQGFKLLMVEDGCVLPEYYQNDTSIHRWNFLDSLALLDSIHPELYMYPRTNLLEFEHIESIDTKDTVYTDLIRSSAPEQSLSGYRNEQAIIENCYIKRDVGIVKFRFSDGKILELIKHHVVKSVEIDIE